MVTPAKKVSGAPVDFGNLDMYTAGGGLPEGDYIWSNLTVQVYAAPAKEGGKSYAARLGVMVTMLPMDGGEPREQFYGMGTKAHESFQPNPETGKGLIAVPGGPASTFNDSTKWAILLKSLADSGLPQGIFTNDVSVLEGMHVHMHNVPEPANWSTINSGLGEAGEQRKAGTIAVVSEIKDDGKPWEGTGGVPEAKAAAKPNGKVAPVTKAAAKPAAKAAPAPEPEANEDVEAAALAGISTVLEKNPKGCQKLILRTGTFKAVNTSAGGEMAQSVIDTYFADDTSLNGLLGQAGFKLQGTAVLPE